jgi:hypothetical protein
VAVVHIIVVTPFRGLWLPARSKVKLRVTLEGKDNR